MRRTQIRPLALLLALVLVAALLSACVNYSQGPTKLSGTLWFVYDDGQGHTGLGKTSYQYDGTSATASNTSRNVITVGGAGDMHGPRDMLMAGDTLLAATAGGLYQVDPATYVGTKIPLPGGLVPTHLVLSPDGNTIWVTTEGNAALVAIPVGHLSDGVQHLVNGADDTRIGALAFGADGTAYYCTCDGGTVYFGTVALPGATTTRRMPRTVPGSLNHLAYDPYTRDLVAVGHLAQLQVDPAGSAWAVIDEPDESTDYASVRPNGLGEAFAVDGTDVVLADFRKDKVLSHLNNIKVLDGGNPIHAAAVLIMTTVVGGGGTEVTAPKAAIDSSLQGLITNNPAPALNGTVYPWFSTVTLTLDGKSTTVKADGMGRWGYTPPGPLSDGPHTLTVSAANSAGTSPAVTATFTVDTTPPAVGIARADGSFTNQAAGALTGTAEAGSSVKVTLNGQLVSTQTVSKDGTWNYAPPAPLADGTYVLQVSATDAAGNSAQASAGFTVDTIPPAIALLGPGDGARSRDGRPLVTGIVEPGSTVSVYADGNRLGAATVDAQGYWSFTPAQALPDGAHSLRAVAADAAGNAGVSSTVGVTVKSSAPAVVIDAPNLAALAITGSTEPGASVTVRLDGEPRGTVTADNGGNWAVPVTETTVGTHQVTVAVLDAYGNTGSASRDFIVPETVSIRGPLYGAVLENRTPVITGRAQPGALVTLTLDGAASGVSADAAGNWSYTPAGPLAYGDHTVTASIKRADGTTFATPPLLFTLVDWH